MVTNYSPINDGIDHVNIYSKGATRLGRMLSNFTKVTIEVPDDGVFDSIEAYWYWLSTGCMHDVLRKQYGPSAKALGRTFPKVHCPNFQERICKALDIKLAKVPNLFSTLQACKLPLTHYYYYGTVDNPKVIHPKDVDWLLDFFKEKQTCLM